MEGNNTQQVRPTVDTTEVRLLPLEYKNRSITFTQLERSKKAAIYKSDAGTFEVLSIVIMEPSVVKFPGMEPKELPARECIPSDSDFGKTTFCYQSEEAARMKFNKLSQ